MDNKYNMDDKFNINEKDTEQKDDEIESFRIMGTTCR